MKLRFGRGPKLTLSESWTSDLIDVNERAHEYLWEPVDIQSKLTIRDILKLTLLSPKLKDIFRNRNPALFDSLSDDFFQTPQVKSKFFRKIDYFYLEKNFTIIPTNKNISDGWSMILYGMGRIEKGDEHEESGYMVGDEWRYEVFYPIENYLDIQVRVTQEVDFIDDSELVSKGYSSPKPRLGEVLDGFFHGTKMFWLSDEDQSSSEEDEDIESEEDTHEEPEEPFFLGRSMDLDERIGKIFCSEIFENFRQEFVQEFVTVHVLGYAVTGLLHSIWMLDDDEQAALQIERDYGGSLKLRSEYMKASGFEIRKLMRETWRKHTEATGID